MTLEIQAIYTQELDKKFADVKQATGTKPEFFFSHQYDSCGDIQLTIGIANFKDIDGTMEEVE